MSAPLDTCFVFQGGLGCETSYLQNQHCNTFYMLKRNETENIWKLLTQNTFWTGLSMLYVSYTENNPNYKKLVWRQQVQVVLSIQIALKEIMCFLNVNQPVSIGKKQFL